MSDWKKQLLWGTTIAAVAVFVSTLFMNPKNEEEKNENQDDWEDIDQDQENDEDEDDENKEEIKKLFSSQNKSKSSNQKTTTDQKKQNLSKLQQNDSKSYTENILQNYRKTQQNHNIYLTEQLSESIRNNIQVEFQDKLLVKSSLIDIINRAIMLSLDELISSRDALVTERRQYKDDPQIFYDLNKFIYVEHFNIINKNIAFTLKSLNLNSDDFQTSLQNQQKDGTIRRGLIRDLAWYFISESRSLGNMSEEQYVQYLELQINLIPFEIKKFTNFFQQKNLDKENIEYFINSRIDDIAYEQLNIEEYDSIQFLQQYLKVEQIQQLYVKRSTLLHSLVEII